MAGLRPPQPDIGTARAGLRLPALLFAPFAMLLLGLALLDRLGLDNDMAATVVGLAALALVGLTAAFSPAHRPADLYVADRSIAAVIAGAALTVGIAGLMMVQLAAGAWDTSGDLVAAAAGLLLGVAVLVLFVAPALRRSGAYSAGDAIAARFGVPARLIAALAGFVSALLLAVAALKTAGPLLAPLLGISPGRGVTVAAVFAAFVVLVGGMRSLTFAQVIQALLVALACVLPAAVAGTGLAGEDGSVDFFPALASLTPQVGEAAGSALQLVLSTLLFAAGAASLPQLVSHCLTGASPRSAGATAAWGVLFSLLLLAVALVLGQIMLTAAGVDPGASLTVDPLAAAAALADLLPPTFQGLLAAGPLAALLGIAEGSLFAAASAISHEFADGVIGQTATAGRRILTVRLAVLAAAVVAALLAVVWTADPAGLLGWALAFAAGGILTPLCAAFWARRCSPVAATVGAGVGFVVVLAAFSLRLGSLSGTSGESGQAFRDPAIGAALGLLLAALATVAVSIAPGRLGRGLPMAMSPTRNRAALQNTMLARGGTRIRRQTQA